MSTKTKKQAFAQTLPFHARGEKLLQYIWQFQYFNTSELKTVEGEKLQILFPGRINLHQGPDFSEARIKIDDTVLAGSVELHVRTSEWTDHGHDADPNYKNVVLHVVFANDVTHSNLPILELQPRISKVLLDKYAALMSSPAFIPCANSVQQVKSIIWHSWKERLLAERLTRKSSVVMDFLKECNDHWEQCFWWLLARNFGMKVNNDAFEAVARSVPVNVLAKHKSQIHQLEALLFGQAGLLGGTFQEEYPKLLQREYAFLRKKYGLNPVHTPVHYLRMRPGNFPTIRLAQLAALIQNSAHLFSRILDIEDSKELNTLFTVTANDYWHYHYRFDDASSFRKKTIGANAIENIIINTVVPVLFTYGLYHKEEKLKSRAVLWLEQLQPELNSITQGFMDLGLPNKSAFDSQAYIELKTQHCDHRQCLQCAIGNVLLKAQVSKSS
jgi:hypothetical protein